MLDDIIDKLRNYSGDIKKKKSLIQSQYDDAKADQDPQRRGKRLEEIMISLFSLESNVRVVGHSINNENEEIDIQLQNLTRNGVWAIFDGMIFVECKHRNTRVDAEIRNFKGIMSNYPPMKAGILVSVSSITGTEDFEGALGQIRLLLA